MRKALFVLLVVLAFMLGGIRAPAARKAQTPLANLRAIQIQCSTEWLKEYVESLLNDRCACVTGSTFAADATLEVDYTNAPAAIAPIREVTVTARLLQAGTIRWSAVRDWPAGTPGMTPRKAATGLATGLVLDLEAQVRLADTRNTTRLFLRRAPSIAILPSGDWDQPVASKWAEILSHAGCSQAVVGRDEASALLTHVEVSGSQVNHISDIVVECASDSHGTYCSDNLGSSSSTECVGSYCSSSSTSGDPNDARPDIQIVAPKFAWMFIDPKTGQRIGNWSTRRDSIHKVKEALGCK